MEGRERRAWGKEERGKLGRRKGKAVGGRREGKEEEGETRAERTGTKVREESVGGTRRNEGRVRESPGKKRERA